LTKTLCGECDLVLREWGENLQGWGQTLQGWGRLRCCGAGWGVLGTRLSPRVTL